jgi:radical SAM superfamily enzyme with C-terminal helix-hairpin-helix motif
MVAACPFGGCMSRKWSKYSERIISEVEAKHGVAWDTDATILLLSFFIEQVSTQSQFRQFLEQQAKVEKATLIEEQEAQGNPVKHSG